MKTITKNVYSFRELLELEKNPESPITSKVVERVRNKLREWSADSESIQERVWPETWKKALEQIGFYDAELSWSGFCSQGDGASFTAKIDFEKLIWFLGHKIKGKDCIAPTKRTGNEEDFLPLVVFKLDGNYGYDPSFRRLSKYIDRISGVITRTSHHYSHENTCNCDIDYDLPESMFKVYNSFDMAVRELRRDLCQAIYKDLEEENDYLSSDEALLEMDDANEYQWDESGHME